MNAQNLINMATALIVFIGGMLIIFFYPGMLEKQTRVLIGVLVLFYSAFRMGTAIMAIRRERRRKEGGLKELINEVGQAPEKPKSP
ncbi:MAG: hypothetical protein GY841_07465 [FCB group bacterium]|nr:hypothetical protein [FCB group bacterium]